MKKLLKQREFLAFLVIVSIGIVLRLIFLMIIKTSPFQGDAAFYFEASEKVISGKAYEPYWPPGLPHYLAIFRLLGISSTTFIRLSMLPWYIGLSTLIMGIFRELKLSKAGLFSIVVLATYPLFIHQSLEPLSQLPAAALLCVVIFFLIRAKNHHHLSYFIFAGVSMGILILFRPASIILIPLFVFGGYSIRKKVVDPLVFLLCLIVLPGIWEVKCYQMTERVVMINDANARNIYLGNNQFTPNYKTWYLASHWGTRPDAPVSYRKELARIDKLPQSKQVSIFRKKAFDYIKQRPDKFGLRTFSRARTFWVFDTFTGSSFLNNYKFSKSVSYSFLGLDALFFCTVFIFGLIGFFIKKNQLNFFIVLTILLSSLPYWLSFSHPTYHIPVLPLFLILNGNLIDQWLRKKSFRKVLASFSKKKKFLLAGSLLIFILLQVEWIWHMLHPEML